MKTLFFVIVFFFAACASIPKGAAHTPLVHGHRGSRGTHPENTIPAFKEAVSAGANVLELDLHLTKDNTLIISHDPAITGKLCKDANGKQVKTPVMIRKMTYAKLKTYDCGSTKQERFPEQALAKSSVPSFEEFLIWYSKEATGRDLNVETKMDAPTKELNPDPKLFASLVIALLRKHNLIERTILQSFDFSTLEEAKKIEPKLRLSCLFEEDKNFCDSTEKVGATIASPDFKLVTKELVESCHQKNIQVAPWTINTEAEWKLAQEMNVDAIITDYTRKLVTFLH